MHPALQRNAFFVKEHVGLFKAANNYDVLDPQTGQIVLLCREDDLGFFTRILRFTDYKRMTPFDIRCWPRSPRSGRAWARSSSRAPTTTC